MTQTNERIADLAAGLFYEHGVTATGVEALSKAAGISKRTLYEQFGSKDGLITAAFASWDVPVFERFTKPAERAATHPAHEVIRRHKDRFRLWFEARAREAGAADPAGLARQLMIVHAGIQDEALIERSAKPASDGRKLVSALLDATL
jgi:AcrR family transcriptional regulator